MFGSVLELLYASASVPWPSAITSTSVRRNPVPREATVPSAITLLDLARLGEVVSAARCGPVAGTGPASGSRILVRLSWRSAWAPRSLGTNRGAGRGGASG